MWRRVQESRKAGIEWALRVRMLAVDLPGRIGSTQRVDLRGLGRRITGMKITDAVGTSASLMVCAFLIGFTSRFGRHQI